MITETKTRFGESWQKITGGGPGGSRSAIAEPSRAAAKGTRREGKEGAARRHGPTVCARVPGWAVQLHGGTAAVATCRRPGPPQPLITEHGGSLWSRWLALRTPPPPRPPPSGSAKSAAAPGHGNGRSEAVTASPHLSEAKLAPLAAPVPTMPEEEPPPPLRYLRSLSSGRALGFPALRFAPERSQSPGPARVLRGVCSRRPTAGRESRRPRL